MASRRYRALEALEQRLPGRVHRGLDELTGSEVALEDLDIQLADQGIASGVFIEAAALRLVRHPNVVRLLDVHVNGTHSISLAFEMRCTTVDHYMLANGKFTGVSLQRAAYQSVLGIECLHSNGISHNFISTTNILIDPASKRITISDLSWSDSVVQVLFRGQALESAFGAHQPCGFSGDIWSLGCLIAEMIVARPLFPSRGDYRERWLHIFKVLGTPCEATWPGFSRLLLPKFHADFSQWPGSEWPGSGLAAELHSFGGNMDASCLDCLELTLRYLPEARASAQDLLGHRFFYDIKNQPEILGVVDRCTLRGGPPSLAGAFAQFAEHSFPDTFAKDFHGGLQHYLGDSEITERTTSALDLSRLARADLHRSSVNICRLKSLHDVSEKHKPSLRSVRYSSWCKRDARAKCLDWCGQLCAVMKYPDNVLFHAMLSLDRWVDRPDEHSQLALWQTELLAAMLNSLKINKGLLRTRHDLPGVLPLVASINHFSQGRLEFADIATSEMQMVSSLQGVVAVPTLWDHFDTLGKVCLCTFGTPAYVSFGAHHVSLGVYEFARFLLQLSLADIDLLYGYSDTVLATSVWLTSMYAVGSCNDRSTDSFSRARISLLREASSVAADLPSLYLDLYACCQELLEVYCRLCLPISGTYPQMLCSHFVGTANILPLERSTNWHMFRSFLERAFKETTAFMSCKKAQEDYRQAQASQPFESASTSDQELFRVMEAYYKGHPRVARFETVAKLTEEELEAMAKSEADVNWQGYLQYLHPEALSAGKQGRLRRVMEEYHKGHPNVARFESPPNPTKLEAQTMAMVQAEAAAGEETYRMMEHYYQGHPNVGRFTMTPSKIVVSVDASRLTVGQAVQASGG